MRLSNRIAGVIGLSLSCVLFILAIWRLCHHFSSNGFWWSSRRTFHLLFCLAMFVEALSYADLCQIIDLSSNPLISERLGYILLDILGRSLLEVITFSVVTGLWLETVERNHNRLVQTVLILPCATIVLVTAVLQSWTLLRSEQEVRWIYKLHCSVEAICWLLHCVAASACCFLTAKKIMSLSTFPQFGASARIKILLKALLPMLLCSVCYGLRSGCMLTYELESRTPTYSRDSLFWWIGFSWLPTLIPSLMLLYSTRKRDVHLGDHHDTSIVPLLLSPPVPPAEAFINFQRLNLESFWSPMSFRVAIDTDGAEHPHECIEPSNDTMNSLVEGHENSVGLIT